jgi:hypothetical protein
MFAKENMLFVKNTGIKKILFISLFFLSWSCLMAKTYYVAPPTATPAGKDSNPGTINAPWATWGKAVWTAQAGDTVYFRGGVYYVTSTVLCDPLYGNGNNGTKTDPICYFNYPNEKPILDGINKTSPSAGLQFYYASHIRIKGLTVRNNFQITQDYLYAMNFYFFRCTDITVENCVAYNSGRRGFYVNLCDDILLLNCDSYNNYDPLVTGYPGGGGDGFLVWDNGTAEFADATITLRNCRAWNNSDDGFDVEIEGLIVMENCWSFNNGYDDGDGIGIKIGLTDYKTTGVKRRIHNCITAFNLETGLNTNDRNNIAKGMEIYNNISYRNGYKGATAPAFGYYICNTSSSDEQELTRIFRNNIAFDNEGGPIGVARYALYTHDHNSWDIPITLTDNDFVSLDSTGISGPRKPDGSLPDLNGFLKLKAGSKAIDAGVDVGLPYFGKAPDLGAYEYEPEEIINQYPLISITSPESGDVFTTPVNITITTNASDPDGNIAKVEFFNGSVKIGEKTSAPWSFTWSNVPEGTYNISAVATDNMNAKTPSSAVKITVNQAPRVTNQAPSVSIVKPVAGAVFTAPATIAISADATDNDGLISKVEFFQGTTKLGERTSSPWTFNWNNVPSGSYSLTATATDNSGSKTTSSAVNITVRAYPVISITSPVSGSSFTAPANITIAANASDPDGSISKVEFFNGTSSIVSLNAAPWTFTWNDVAAGTYSLTAVATDNSGLKTTSAAITLTVKNSPPPVINQPPVISISDIRPETSFFAPAKITISATATDPDGSVASVEFFNKTTSLGVITSAPWSIVWNDVPEGNYSITAVATDNLGAKTTSSAVSLTIYKKPNQPPAVSIVSPVNGQIFKKNDVIMITVAASDPDGSIERIELYDGNEFLAKISSSPYTYSWKYAEKGIHTLSAVAIDNLNESTVSSQVSIEVKAGQFYPIKNKTILNLYPNPNDGNFTVAFSSSAPEGLGVIDIVSAEGKSITRKIVGNENTTMTFNLSYIKSGLYILIYKNKGKIIATKKFFKY